MKKIRARFVVTTLAGIAALTAGTAYLLGVSPFERTGTIEASEACKNLGSSEKVIPAIKELAPPKHKYSFAEQNNRGSVTHFSGCFVRADEIDFLVTRTEDTPTGSMTFETWAEGPASRMVTTEDPKNFDRFGTDTWGVVSRNKAALAVPCLPRGKQSLTTVVLLRDSAEPNRGKDRYRQELIDLAKSAAAFAHEDANCTLPLKID
ncbi:hypothetical protein [Streptomyces cyaneofuscatus]|uniref:hypothetical protein n=1 Tax=Streptomyces cyaneofuscatus TaxID=66883 RepID=UPI003797272A